MKRFTLIICIIFIVILTIMMVGCSGDSSESLNTVCFHDNATFGGFADEKLEKFKIEKECKVDFLFEGSIESGAIEIILYDENENIIYENTSLSYNDKFVKTLTPGVYSYYLLVDNCKNGKIHNKAEIIEIIDKTDKTEKTE